MVLAHEGGAGAVRPFADLHTHSTCSDGVLSCEEIYAAADAAGLFALAVTDHDTMAGAEGLAAADAPGPVTVPGMELSTLHDGRPVHMLAYFCDASTPALAQVCARTNETRTERALAIAERLEADGYPVHPEALAACGKVVNRSLVARALVEAGAAPDTDAVFDTLIGLGCPYYVDRVDIESIEAISLVREAQGFPFIAHPAAYHVVDLIAGFAKEGLAGVEAFYPQHTEKERAGLATLARELGLGVCGGSDWHGDSTHGSSLGAAGLDRAQFFAFIEACGRDAREWGAC